MRVALKSIIVKVVTYVVTNIVTSRRPGWVKITHCLRHSLRDRLRDAEVPLEAIDQIGGWSSVGGAGSKYGRGYTTSKLARYMKRVAID